MPARTIKAELQTAFRQAGIPVAEYESAPPFVFIGFGGSSEDSALIQAAFSVTIVVPATQDIQILAAQVWRLLWASTDYIPLTVVADDAPPGVDATAVIAATIFANTTFNWWEE